MAHMESSEEEGAGQGEEEGAGQGEEEEGLSELN